MSIIQHFGNSEIRFVKHPEGKFEFGIVAADLAVILEASEGKGLAKYVDDEWKGVINNHTPGGTQAMTVIWEPGIYQLLAKSRKPQAKPFQKWLFEEVLPSIRKTGQYTIATQPPQQPAPQQLPQVTAIALAGLDAALSGVINPSLLAGVKLNAIAALHPETNIALEEGRKLLSHATITQGQLLTPTELGERLGISARKVNQLLIEKGLQIKNPDQHKGASAYLPTDKGLEFAEFTLATGRKGDNTSYQHIKWYPNVARVLNPQISVVA
jgi:prophage antirepressor-like protein